MSSEAAFERKACTWAHEKLDVSNIKLQKRKGWPDRMFMKEGRVLFVEFKREDGNGVVSPLQVHIIKQLQMNKFAAFIADDFEKFKILMEAWVNGKL